MSYSGDNQPLKTPTPAIPSGASTPPRALRDWAQAARREIEERLDTIQRAASGVALEERHRPGMRPILDAVQQARDTLATLDALLTIAGQPLRAAPLEVSDLLMAALARWKPRAPQHTFELALPGYEPALVGDASRIERALDALLAWLVASSSGGDVRVALRYTPDAGSDATAAGNEALITLRASLRPDARAPIESLAANAPPAEGSLLDPLALALSREVAAAHGGSVWARAEPENGAFTLGITLPPTPTVQPALDTSSAKVGALPEDEPGAAASPSLPLTRQRQVALVAHADPRMTRYLRVNLERAGYRALTAADLAATLRQIDAEEPDVVLLDAGLDAGNKTNESHMPLQRALARTTAPVILLTREVSPAQAAAALDSGAADVIALPFSIEETLARVRRTLRSAPVGTRGDAGGVTMCGDLVIHEAERRVTLSGAPVMLSKTEFRLLRTLARHAGKIVAHETLLEQVWGPGYNQEYEFIWVYIRRLRRKIEPDPSRPRYIQTAPGVGYLLAAPVSEPAGV